MRSKLVAVPAMRVLVVLELLSTVVLLPSPTASTPPITTWLVCPVLSARERSPMKMLFSAAASDVVPLAPRYEPA